MAKRLAFSISKELGNSLNSAVSEAEVYAGKMRFEILPMDKVEIDPLNPRELYIQPHELLSPLNSKDLRYKEKEKELEALTSLSKTINDTDLLNPIVVYPFLDKYRIAAGERRYLASILGKKSTIQARIKPEKPTELELRILQWVENYERVDLPLNDRIRNIQLVLKAYAEQEKSNLKKSDVIEIIIQHLGLAKSRAYSYADIINAPEEVLALVMNGDINHAEKASFIAKEKDPVIRSKLIKLAKEGKSLIIIKKNSEIFKAAKSDSSSFTSDRGVKHKSITLKIRSPMAAEKLCEVFQQLDFIQDELKELQLPQTKDLKNLNHYLNSVVLILEKKFPVINK